MFPDLSPDREDFRVESIGLDLCIRGVCVLGIFLHGTEDGVELFGEVG